MRNVVVVAVGRDRYAVELRWVQEIFALAHLTPIPGAPPAVAGAANFRGAILPVLAGGPLLAALTGRPSAARAPAPGDAVVLLEVEGTRAGLAVERVDEVTTLETAPGAEGRLRDGQGQEVVLLDAAGVVAEARRQIAEAAAAAVVAPSSWGRTDRP